jgi:hypothetical protein
VSRIRKRNYQSGRCSGGVGLFYKEKLYQRVQLLNNVGPNGLWIILKTDEGKEGKVCIGVCYNPPRGSKYENPRFFEKLISKIGTSVTYYILCSYDTGRCLKTFRVRNMAISDHNIIETVTEVEDRNRADKMNEYYSKQLKTYKWYERMRNDFEQRRDGKSIEIFVLGVEYFLCRREIENAITVSSDMLKNVGWQMEKRGNEGRDWRRLVLR